MVEKSSLLIQTLSKDPGAPPCTHKPLSPGQLQDNSQLPSNMASHTPTFRDGGGEVRNGEGAPGTLSPFRQLSVGRTIGFHWGRERALLETLLAKHPEVALLF